MLCVINSAQFGAGQTSCFVKNRLAYFNVTYCDAHRILGMSKTKTSECCFK